MANACDDILRRLNDWAACPVCLSVLSRPRSLPCGHTFCLDCIERVVGDERRIYDNGVPPPTYDVRFFFFVVQFGLVFRRGVNLSWGLGVRARHVWPNLDAAGTGSRVFGEGAPGSNYNMLRNSEVHYTMIRRTFTIYILADLPVYCHFAVTLLGVSNICPSAKYWGLWPLGSPVLTPVLFCKPVGVRSIAVGMSVWLSVSVCLSARVSQKQQ